VFLATSTYICRKQQNLCSTLGNDLSQHGAMYQSKFWSIVQFTVKFLQATTYVKEQLYRLNCDECNGYTRFLTRLTGCLLLLT